MPRGRPASQRQAPATVVVVKGKDRSQLQIGDTYSVESFKLECAVISAAIECGRTVIQILHFNAVKLQRNRISFRWGAY